MLKAMTWRGRAYYKPENVTDLSLLDTYSFGCRLMETGLWREWWCE
jgi:hypothetical protein